MKQKHRLYRKLKVIIIAGIIFSIYTCRPDDNDNDWPQLYEIISLEQITSTNSSIWDFHPRWSHDGNKIAFARFNSSISDLALYIWDKTTKEVTEIVSGMYGDCSISWNPDDTKIAIDVRDENEVSQIYIVNVDNGEMTKFTNNSVNSFRPAWSNDGEKIVYVESYNLYLKATTGGSVVRIAETQNAWNPLWSPDDTKILFSKESHKEDIYSIFPDGTGLTLLAEGNSPPAENWASWSPDGNEIVYQLYNKRTTRLVLKDLITDEVYLLLERNDCRFPHWSPDGNSIVFAYQENLWILTFK